MQLNDPKNAAALLNLILTSMYTFTQVNNVNARWYCFT